jgi:hypothetical protein
MPFSFSLRIHCSRRNRALAAEAPEPAPEPEEEDAAEGFEVVREAGAPRTEPVLQRPSDEDCQNRTFRVYAVISVPGLEVSSCGIHWSWGKGAYDGVLALNGGHFGGIQWKRQPNLTAAIAFLQSECQRKHLPVPSLSEIKFFDWRCRD